MKGSCTLIASVLAASTAALKSSSSSGDLTLYSASDVSYVSAPSSAASQKSSPTGEMERFAAKFDGLKFIETLVTAHR